MGDATRLRGGRIVGFDGIRAVAVVVVLAHHAGLLPGGYLGVDLFFVLSGFLITGLLLDEIGTTGTVSLRRFWARRVARLTPALLAYLAVGLALAFTIKEGAARSHLVQDAIASLAGVVNWLAVVHPRNSAWADHLWSLSVEQQFYLLWPLLLLALTRSRWRRHVVAVLTIAVLAVAVWRAGLVGAGWNSGLRWYLGTDVRADSLLVGAILAVLWRRGTLSRIPAPFWRLGAVLAGAAWIAAVALSPANGDGPNWLAYGGFTLVAVLAAVVIGSVVGDPDGPLTRLLSWGPAVWLGGISYAFYLWHYPVTIQAAQTLGPRIGAAGAAVVAAIVSAALAQGSMWLVERPALRWSRRHEKRRAAEPAAVRVAGRRHGRFPFRA